MVLFKAWNLIHTVPLFHNYACINEAIERELKKMPSLRLLMPELLSRNNPHHAVTFLEQILKSRVTRLSAHELYPSVCPTICDV